MKFRARMLQFPVWMPHDSAAIVEHVVNDVPAPGFTTSRPLLSLGATSRQLEMPRGHWETAVARNDVDSDGDEGEC